MDITHVVPSTTIDRKLKWPAATLIRKSTTASWFIVKDANRIYWNVGQFFVFRSLENRNHLRAPLTYRLQLDIL